MIELPVRRRSRTHSALCSLLPLLTLTALACAATASAQTFAPVVVVTLDPATTAIHWTLDTSVHTVHGAFTLKSGAFRIDTASGDAEGLIVIDAASGESGDAARDKRMHAVVLESAKYPVITFRPTHVSGDIDLTAAGPVTVKGILNLHGEDHATTIVVRLHPQGAAVVLETHFSIPFIAWGLKDPSSFLFRTEKEVELDVAATASYKIETITVGPTVR